MLTLASLPPVHAPVEPLLLVGEAAWTFPAPLIRISHANVAAGVLAAAKDMLSGEPLG